MSGILGNATNEDGRIPGPNQGYCVYHQTTDFIDSETGRPNRAGVCATCDFEVKNGLRLSCRRHGLYIPIKGKDRCPTCERLGLPPVETVHLEVVVSEDPSDRSVPKARVVSGDRGDSDEVSTVTFCGSGEDSGRDGSPEGEVPGDAGEGGVRILGPDGRPAARAEEPAEGSDPAWRWTPAFLYDADELK